MAKRLPPTNIFLKDHILTPPPGGWEIHYRRTPPGQPAVPDLIAPDDLVRVHYDIQSAAAPPIRRVLKVAGPWDYAPRDAGGETFPWYSMILTEDGVKADGWINELVAVDGVVLGLFEANSVRVEVVGRHVPPPAPPGTQLTMF